MVNVIKGNMPRLAKEVKKLTKIGQNALLTCKDELFEVYVLSMDKSGLVKITLRNEELLDELVAEIKTDTLATLLKGAKKDTFIGYNNATIQVVTGKKGAIINLSEPDVFDKQSPKIPFTNEISVDGKDIIDFVKEASELFSGARGVTLKHVAKEIILEVVDSGNEANRIATMIPCEPFSGEMCEAKFSMSRLLEILPEGEVRIAFGDSLPIGVQMEEGNVKYYAILAPLVDND